MAGRKTTKTNLAGGPLSVQAEDVEVASLQPVKPAWFHILLSLSEEPRHGFSIRESAEARTCGAVKLWPATLYGAMREMTELQLIEPLQGDEDPDDDQRRVYYRLTRRGQGLLKLEADRLQGLVDAVRASQGLAGS